MCTCGLWEIEQLGMARPRFSSNREFFNTLSELIAELREEHSLAATELDCGFRCLNGLTDGWALLLESIQKVESQHSNNLTQDQRDTLKDLRIAADSLVYRR
jgi:hypothetical protein